MFDPPLALASLSGRSDAVWARAVDEFAGAAFLGGIAICRETRAAARALVARGRTEFLPQDPLQFVEGQLSALSDTPIRPGINVRTVDHRRLGELARICAATDAILEVNAHCRQPEMCAIGAGESLLSNPDRLTTQVRTVSQTGVDVSVKVRAEVPSVDLVEIAEKLEEAGATAIHIDAMDSESVVKRVAVAAPSLYVIANNGVRGEETVNEYLDFGADAVSVGRPSDDPRVLRAVLEAVEEAQTEPKQRQIENHRANKLV